MPKDMFEQGHGLQETKASRRQKRKEERELKQHKRMPKPIEGRTEAQKKYIEHLLNASLVFGIGPAGAGKTYCPARVYGSKLVSGEINKIFVARPPISKPKHRQGFLPGTQEEKNAPWLEPIYDGLRDSMSKSDFDKFTKDGSIEVVAFEFIQGRTFKSDDGAACIIDEAENLDMDDLYITLTRQGENLLMAVCGDSIQSRIPDSGLETVTEMVAEFAMEDTFVVEFTEEDVVRSMQARQWVKAFMKKRGTDNETDYFANNLPQMLR